MNLFISKTNKKSIDKHYWIWYTLKALFGEVSEWFKEPVLKTGDSERGRGFESHLLRLGENLLQHLEKYPSGWRGSPGKGVGRL